MSTPLGHPDTWENSLAGLADRFGQRNRTRDDDNGEVYSVATFTAEAA